MNKFTLVTALLFVHIGFAIAQKYSSAIFSVKPKTGPYNEIGAAVAPVKMNVLYIGVENPLDIAVPGTLAKDITAEIANGTIKKMSDGHFVAMPVSVGKTLVTVKVRGKEVSRHEFRVKLIPDPVIALSGVTAGGSVRLRTFKGITGIQAIFDNYNFEAAFAIKTYRIIFQRGDTQQTVDATSPVFTKEIRKLIEETKVGDVIVFTDVMAVGPDSSTPRRLAEVVFTLI